MPEGKIENYYTHPPGSGNIRNMVILLHGVGSNGRDLISLAPYWAQSLPDTLFISPDAPFRCDMAPPGYPNSYQWFSLQNRDPAVMLEGVKTVEPIVKAFIDEQLKEHNLKPGQLALVGFSQGTMTSLHVGPRYNPPLAGIVGFSGALLWKPEMAKEKLNLIPILLVHGEYDDVVPVDAWHHAMTMLSSCGFEPSGYTQPGLYHSIDQEGITTAASFLQKIFS
ncbi:MAG: dienelactone hydrolase family protein [Rhodospirillales bacterium]|nr:dienelactone hydrolase family protein [Alphaproteobacteria bacterium]MCB9976144.1 dienelactone hydrolase family protein [Rhodospirillales bacterium]